MKVAKTRCHEEILLQIAGPMLIMIFRECSMLRSYVPTKAQVHHPLTALHRQAIRFPDQFLINTEPPLRISVHLLLVLPFLSALVVELTSQVLLNFLVQGSPVCRGIPVGHFRVHKV